MLPLAFALSLACATHKGPDVTLPTFAPLPAVEWHQGPGGALCLTPEQAARLRQREELRTARERTLTEMLRALGAKDP